MAISNGVKLSVIIPTYNEEKFLPKLLETIKGQTFQDYEIIVADANSTDQTRAMAGQFGARVVDGGLPAKARNNGARAASGELFLFLDADVFLPHHEYLRHTVDEFEKNKLAIAASLPHPISKRRVDQLFHHVYNGWVKLFKRLIPHTAGFCIMVRRAVHEKINGFDESIMLAEDHDYARRAARLGPFDFFEEKIPVSVRRFDRDGRANVALKYLVAEAYMFCGGRIKSDFFKYHFGYNNEKH